MKRSGKDEIFDQEFKKDNHVSLIVDTDIGPWSDDFEACEILSKYVQEKRYKILAIMGNNPYDGIVPLIDSVATFYKLSPDPSKPLPIGLKKNSNFKPFKDKYNIVEDILQSFPHPNYQNNSEAHDSTELYRNLLSKSDDDSVDILSIGCLTNLAGLLISKADEISPLNGIELVRQKVRKTVVMAGAFPDGKETNIKGDPESSKIFFDCWPKPMALIGFDLGKQIRSCDEGLNLAERSPQNDTPRIRAIRLTAEISGLTYGCWDAIAAYVLSLDEENPFFEIEYGEMFINTHDGSNFWNPSNKTTLQRRLLLVPFSKQALIEKISLFFR